MPTRRVRRQKSRVPSLTACEWRFFLARTPKDFEKAMDTDGSEFWFLFYHDKWTDVYAAHRVEIEQEWQKRGWTPEMKRFVMMPYAKRGYSLARCHQREERNNTRRLI